MYLLLSLVSCSTFNQTCSFFLFVGSGSLITVVSALQKECDFLSELIINEFRSYRNITPKIHIINEVTRSGSSKTEHIEPKEIDLLLNEITMIHSRYGLYLRFVRARIQVGGIEIIFFLCLSLHLKTLIFPGRFRRQCI